MILIGSRRNLSRVCCASEERELVEYLVGIILAAAVAAFARVTGFDRERSFYATVLIVVASYYILFAAIAESHHAIHVEVLGVLVFTFIAVVGYQRDSRYIAAGLIGHGLFDFVHHRFVSNPGVPVWWPGFCLGFDVAVGAWLFFALRRTAKTSSHSLSPTIGR
jgi:hypothetical protein